jgi:hypothetical protein
MASREKFSILRGVLRALGLSPQATEDILDRITFLLSGKEEDAVPEPSALPYVRRDDFLTPAEHSFYHVLRTMAADRALIFPQVALSNLFRVTSTDQSELYTYTNKIDRKRVDFLLCEPVSLRPLVGIELDDGSHRRSDRQTRDAFVENVFIAAGLPLIRVETRQGYSVQQLEILLSPYIGAQSTAPSATPVSTPLPPEPAIDTPHCPQCNTPMVLRTARSGPNQGGKFWGCPNYPRCRGIVKYEG